MSEGETDRTKCHVCGVVVNCWSEEVPSVCPDHCEDHEYEYVREERRYECKTCGVEPPHDWWGYDPE